MPEIRSLPYYIGFSDGLAGKESSSNAGELGLDPWVGKIPWRREWLLTPVLWPGEFRRLYSPWGHKESDTTEQLSLHSAGLNIHFGFPGGLGGV